MGKAGHIPEGGDAAFVFAGIKPSLKADLQVMLLSFLMEVGRLLPLVSSSGNRTTYTSLSGYEAVSAGQTTLGMSEMFVHPSPS